MRRALELAAKGWGHTAPNPMVGAVVVSGDAVVGEGFHAAYGEPHAETVALEAAGDAARGGTLYVTLEPCAHRGQTPPCTEAVIKSGVARVVAAVRDPTPPARGGAELLRAQGISVEFGVEADEAIELNAPFFHAVRSSRPWVVLKLAVSIDGAIGTRSREQRWLTGEDSRREVHRMRAGFDAIAVGAGTVLSDDPELTVRLAPPPRRAPLRVIFDRELRTPATAKVVTTARQVPTLIMASVVGAQLEPLKSQGVEIIPSKSHADALEKLRARNVRSLLVEGGAGLAGQLLEQNLLDRLVIFQAPLLLGDGSLAAFGGVTAARARELGSLRVVSRRNVGADVMTVYDVARR
ncbi:MAG TPA: bifunctional diaminohydroxyphosphoribosylaminopyrimidine deaminase/5-amino-6-(5-phosphoribosylamino)uracil reductase RibD [Gemmatimonadaceae bacterium]|nr:bifunctional diaminohydroxyphosphoribosylaminopyrimidine deaminase/5-amino-6-(5-phosphoribosylamino)uracil reductase RibD [Gemmatimonadaceae bacterium]